ncbi:hypothetical protein BGX27_005000 [Mortierella sp. AM989]|nr:hypothetical protein BGX27_005000 [Mortierella sp. AM989]
MNKTSPSLPSPPLSPHQFTHPDHDSRSNSLPMLPLPTAPTLKLSSSTSGDTSHTSISTAPTEASFPVGTSPGEEIDEIVPMLPSQLRRRHESMKLLAKKQQPIIHEPADECQDTEPQDRTTPNIELNPQELGDAQVDSDEIELINASYHSGALIRAKSNSLFESSSHGSSLSHPWSPSQQMEYMNGLSPASALNHHGEVRTRDWITIQSKMQALELEISHVRRTNILLNQELDKVNTHLTRITANGDDDEDGQAASWRREYEFLVQQVDWMHQQLQLAHAEKQGRSQYQAEMTQELCSEVKGLTASLKMWQSAFEQAEEKYRRKCDGEQVLKQTLRERETQLSSLVEKLTGYESEFQKSISNYEGLMRLSAGLEMVEGNNDKPSLSKQLTLDSSLRRKSVSDMPGTFPGHQWHCQNNSETALVDGINTTTDQLTVSILSWATLLATFMLS